MRSTVPKMTKAHFELIASIIRQVRDPEERRAIAKDACGRLLMSNGLFDKQRFLDAAIGE